MVFMLCFKLLTFSILFIMTSSKDAQTHRMYWQLTKKIPTNESSLQVMSQMNFYQAYFTMANQIFSRYGIGSTRAEAEICKVVMTQLIWLEEKRIPTNEEFLGFYQVGPKKMFITMNEMRRESEDENPICLSVGADRHVHTFVGLVTNPLGFTKQDQYIFVRWYCQSAPQYVLWNLNEIWGYTMQCLAAGKGSKAEQYALNVLSDVFKAYPMYKEQWYDHLNLKPHQKKYIE